MMRHLESDGALIEFNKWEHSAKGLRMLSVKTPGPRSVCFIAEKNAWLQLWHWPRLGLINNGSYPNWDRSTRKKGEKYEIKHFISITNNDATVPEKSSVRFTTTNN
jgi:hypothetical protein